jgi:predicted membrane-bound spermidine synthase
MAKRKISHNATNKIFFLVLCCFFLSGLSGLIYEILWTRMVVKIIGSAPFAVSIVLTIFMGGLGLGSYIASLTCPGRQPTAWQQPTVFCQVDLYL